MNSKKEIKHRLIDKISSCKNEKLLARIDQLMESSTSEEDVVLLTKEQKRMLKMSDRDIEEGEVISQRELNRDDLEWLREK
jgi:hypothetical protein